jgi:hypothetical protein
MIPGPTDYTSAAMPPAYRCGTCGDTGVKLWRRYQTFLDHQDLLCGDCAAKDQGEEPPGADGKIETDCGRSDAIGWMVPAVPTESGETFWGYTSVPQAGVEWWHRLPTRRAKGEGRP